MILLYDQFISEATGISATNEDTTFPAANLQDTRLSRQFRTDGNFSTEITIDLGQDQVFDTVAVGGTNFNAGTVFDIDFNTTNSFPNSPQTFEGGSEQTLFDVGYQDARYVKITVSAGQSIIMGNVAVGIKYDAPDPGTDFSREEISTGFKSQSITGQVYGDNNTFLYIYGFQLPRILDELNTRVTEDGDVRITEDGQTRVTQQSEKEELIQFFQGADWNQPVYVDFNNCIEVSPLYVTLENDSIGLQATSNRNLWTSRLDLRQAK